MRRAFVAAGVLAMIAAGCGTEFEEERTSTGVSYSELKGGSSGLSPAQHKELANVRKLTRKYKDVSQALADGFVPAGGCVESPEGGMGYHYVHFGRFFAPVDPLAPAGLVYAPAGRSGHLKLAAVEYFVPIFQDGVPYTGAAPPDASSVPPTPTIFGMAFEGPMPGHEPGMPWHFDKHIWIWRANPLGIGSPWNPNVRCPAPA